MKELREVLGLQLVKIWMIRDGLKTIQGDLWLTLQVGDV